MDRKMDPREVTGSQTSSRHRCDLPNGSWHSQPYEIGEQPDSAPIGQPVARKEREDGLTGVLQWRAPRLDHPRAAGSPCIS